ncbi:MAG: hypothetical protein U0270_42750 [Labilithrix sp.]
MSAYRDNQREALPTDQALARDRLRSVLSPGEELLWANRPKRGLVFERNPHAFTQIVWTLFSLTWTFAGLITDVSFGVSMLGIPFVMLGLYGLLGHSVHRAWRHRELVYGITNRRLLVAAPSRIVAAPALAGLRTHLVMTKGGLGNIRVVAPHLELRAIPDAAEVHRILVEAQALAPESEVPASAPVSSAPVSGAPVSTAPDSDASGSSPLNTFMR